MARVAIGSSKPASPRAFTTSIWPMDRTSSKASRHLAARAAGVFVLSGVSSFPVLTAAGSASALGPGPGKGDARSGGGIAPSPYAGVGMNVIRAIAGYAGQPCTLRRSGRSVVGYPFTEHMRFTIAPPGRVPLRSTLFSLVDVPDLRALAGLWPEADGIWMGAGPVPELLHSVRLPGLRYGCCCSGAPSGPPAVRRGHEPANIATQTSGHATRQSARSISYRHRRQNAGCSTNYVRQGCRRAVDRAGGRLHQQSAKPRVRRL